MNLQKKSIKLSAYQFKKLTKEAFKRDHYQ